MLSEVQWTALLYGIEHMIDSDSVWESIDNGGMKAALERDSYSYYARHEKKGKSHPHPNQWTYDVIITSLLRQNHVEMSFWCNNDVIILGYVRWIWTTHRN